jgi:uncharacterized protein (DUF433 family)
MAATMPDLDLPDLLTCTPQGTWRIAGTRVSLDSVIHSFWEGATPEEICQDFPSLSLAQVYEAIAYYLKQRDKVDAYLQAGRDGAEKLQQELNGRHRDFLSRLRQQLLSNPVTHALVSRVKYLFDEDLNGRIVRGMRRRISDLDSRTVQGKQISLKPQTLRSLTGQLPKAGS